MSSNTQEMQKKVLGGERHIYVNTGNETDFTQPQRRKARQKPVLENREMRNIPIATSLNSEMKNIASQPTVIKIHKGKKNDHPIAPTALPESSAGVYGAPELHSTLRVSQALSRVREEEPDLPQMLQDKLQSPNTATRVKKQKAKRVNISGGRQIFNDLVSVDVREKDLADQLEDQLQMKAAIVQPRSRPRDPEPQQSDYLNLEDYVTSTPVTSVYFQPPFSCVRPYRVGRGELCRLYSQLME